MLWVELFACGRGETWATILKASGLWKVSSPCPWRQMKGTGMLNLSSFHGCIRGEQLPCCVYSRLVAPGRFVDRFTCWRRTRFRSKSVCFPFIWRFWIGGEDSCILQYRLQASNERWFSLIWVSALGNATQVSQCKKGLIQFENR